MNALDSTTMRTIGTTMTDEEAQAEAVRRWGPDAYIERKHWGACDVGQYIHPRDKFNLRRLYGWGDTFEAAFKDAEERGYHEQVRRLTLNYDNGWREPKRSPAKTKPKVRTPPQLELPLK